MAPVRALSSPLRAPARAGKRRGGAPAKAAKAKAARAKATKAVAGRPAWEYSDLALFWDRAFDACSLPDAAAHIERLSARGLATCGRGAVLVAAEYLTSARGAGAGFGAGRAKGAAGIDGVPMVESSLRRYYLPRELLTGGEVPSEASVPLPDEAEYVRMVGAGADHVRLLGLTADAGTLSFAEKAQLMEPPYEPGDGEMVLYLCVSVDGSRHVMGADVVRCDDRGHLLTRSDYAADTMSSRED